MRARACAPSWRSAISASTDRPPDGAKRHAAHAVIVLGAAVLPDGRPSPPLRRRVRAAVELHGSLEDCILVMSGGLGRYGPPEARVMRDLAVEAGVDSHDILLEEYARNTRENIQNSTLLMRRMNIGRLHVVSDDFHLPRCRLYAALAGIRAEFHPAASRGQGDSALRLAFYRVRETIGLAKYVWVGLIDRFGGHRG